MLRPEGPPNHKMQESAAAEAAPPNQTLEELKKAPLNAAGAGPAQIAHHKRFISFDAIAFDSTVPADVYSQVITRLSPFSVDDAPNRRHSKHGIAG